MTSPISQNPQNSLGDSLDWQLHMGADEAVVDDPTTEWQSPPTQSPATATTTQTSPIPNPIPNPIHNIGTTPPTANTKPPPAPPPDFAAATTLDELRDMCLNFKAAEYLQKTATQLVFADGNPNADFMLIGEAPGADEDRQGKPFVGASGQLLDKMLASINISRKQSAYITNIVLWRPPGNRTPTTEEIALFLPILHRHIALIAPKVIMCLGKIATQAMLEKPVSILKTRGTWCEYNDNIPLMPSLHPAYLLRSPIQKGKVWQDLRLVHRKLETLQK